MKYLIPIFIILFASCRRPQIAETTERVTTTIDTAVVIPPVAFTHIIDVPQLITRPQTIKTERTNITLNYDTTYNTIRVDQYVKPDTVYVQQTKIIERKSSEVTPQPKRVSRFRWFIYGAVFVIIARFIYRVYVYTNIPHRPRF